MLLFCDSFDHYATAQLDEKYSASNGPSYAAIVTGGRTGTYALSLSYGGGYVKQSYPETSKFVVGFAMSPAAQQIGVIVEFDDGNTVQGQLRLNAAGGVEYWTYNSEGFATLVVSSVPGLIRLNTYQYLEVSVVFSTSATGSASAQLNGQSIFAITNIVTSASANNSATSVTVVNGGNVDAGLLVDDLYICNGSGTINNSFLGDVSVECLLPNGPGQVTGSPWTPFGAQFNYECVNEVPPLGATYVYSSTPGNIDLYTIASLPGTPSAVVAVQIVACAEKTDSSSRVLGVGFGNNTSFVFNAGSSLTNSYVMYPQPYDQDPITNAAWTVANVNNGQIGIKEIA
jgi:hypothetical protein